MLNFWQKILRHKFIAVVIIIVLAVAGYYGYKKWWTKPAETRYVLATAEKGTLIVSVSGSGQISASNQIDLKPKASGDLVYVGAKNGQEIKNGILLAQLDSRDAQKTVRDAQANLESAQISLEKLKQPADALSILQAENTLIQAKESKQNATDDLAKAYEDGFNKVAAAFLDLPTIMTGLNSLCFSSTIEKSQWNADWYANQVIVYDEIKVPQYKKDVYDAYQSARQKYDDSFAHYKIANRNSDLATIEGLIMETYETVKSIAEATKAANNFLDLVKDLIQQHNGTIPSTLTTYQSNLNSYTGTTNTQLSNLLSIKQTIEDSKKAIISADRTIAEKTESLANLKAGADPLDIQSQELSLKQKENSLLDAKEKLADYFVRAPFDGIIAQWNVKKGDAVSASTVLGTLITKQKIAEVTLNEVDIAKVKVDQKATLTFDAIDGLSISGDVIEVGALGTVSQGVVTYAVKIGFDTPDERVKPSMSVSAAIITEAKPDALMVPNAAVKASGNAYYVEMPDETVSPSSLTDSSGVVLKTPPRQQSVEIGLANDSMTEILSGLKEGDAVVTRIITVTAASSQTQPKSILQQVTGSRSNNSVRVPTGGAGFRD